MKHIFIIVLALSTLSCTSTNSVSKEEKQAQNIIFLIGDGMGLSAVSTGFYYGEQNSVFKEFKHLGLQQTSSATHKITDSAASGTALSSGTKTYNGAIGVDTSKTALVNMTEKVSELGWSTGVVATSTISHATPAAFYAHVESRQMEEIIAEQLLNSEIDFFAGGGRDKFTKRADGNNLLLTVAAEMGFEIDTLALAEAGTLDAGKKYGFLPQAGAMPPMIKGRENFLPEATNLALSHLSKNEEGFFLMVESSQIDWAGHGNDKEFLIGEMLDFEEVIRAALAFAKEDGNTLVVVTADHETGGFALGPKAKGAYEEKYSDYDSIDPVFATAHHTATLIPVFAYGPGAECFEGVYQNTAIHSKMARLAGFEE